MTEYQWGLVADTIADFEHAVALARGTADPRSPEAATVPRTDMTAAAAIAREVRLLVVEWRGGIDSVRWPAVMMESVRYILAGAVDAARGLESATRDILAASPPNTAHVRSVAGGWPPIWARQLGDAFETLDIIVGERPLAGSAIAAAAETTESAQDALLTLIPIVGEVVLAFEAGT